MADTKISGLPADASPTTDDLVVTVNDPGGTPATRKVTVANLAAAAAAADTTHVLKAGDTMSGVLNMGSQRISSVAAPTTANDALNIGALLGLYLPVASVSAGAITGGVIRRAQSILLTGNYSQTVPPTEEAVNPGVRVNWQLTMSDNAGGLGPQYGFANATDGFGPPGIFDISGLIRVAANMGTFTFPPIGYANVLKVANNASVARTITPAWRFLEAGTIYADGATVTLAANDINNGGAAFADSQVLGTKNSGTLAGTTNSIGLTSLLSSPIVLGNSHMTFRYGVDIMEPNFYLGSIASSTLETALGMDAAGGGIIDTQIGVNIRRLTYATTNIGIKNASTSVEPLLAATLANAAATIPITATAVALTNSSGGALTLTSTPIMAAGQDGQRITLLNVGANSIILNDGGSSGLQFRSQGSRITLLQGDIATFVYSTTLSLWFEVTAGSMLTSATMTGANVVKVVETGTGDRAEFTGTGGFGLGIGFFLSADTVARTTMSALAIAFGPGGSTATDWSLARTALPASGVPTATVVGSLVARIRSAFGNTTSSATPSINTDSTDFYELTAQAAAITSFTTNLTGTPTRGQELAIAITDNGTARAITWGASFASTPGHLLPTTTVASTRLVCRFRWNVAGSTWDLIDTSSPSDPRTITTNAPGATPTVNTNLYTTFEFTGLAAAITSMTTNLSGAPTNSQKMNISFTDNGTARAITWGASYEASTIALPTTTVVNARLDVAFLWNAATTKWRCVGVA